MKSYWDLLPQEIKKIILLHAKIIKYQDIINKTLTGGYKINRLKYLIEKTKMKI